MSTFGRLFRVTTMGESHSANVGCIVEGFPANVKVDRAAIQHQLNRRRPGQSNITTPRSEDDTVAIVSGLNGQSVSLGSPITMLVNNQNIKAQDYNQFDNVPRPGHADMTYLQKYGIKAESGGGRSSARETVGRVCAGALAQSFLKGIGITFSAWVSSVGSVSIPNELNLVEKPPSQDEIDLFGTFEVSEEGYTNRGNGLTYPVAEESRKHQTELINIRCPHPETGYQMIRLIEKVKEEQDSIGGVITCCIQGVPPGLGEPCFDKLPALLAHAMLSLPAVKGFEIGSGFDGTKLRGSQHNDPFTLKDGVVRPLTNHAGGTLGGISTGENIYFRVAFKPVSTIGQDQPTVDLQGQSVVLKAKGRHDPCVLPRAPPIIECMAAIVIMDLILIKRSQAQEWPEKQFQTRDQLELQQLPEQLEQSSFSQEQEGSIQTVMDRAFCSRQTATQYLQQNQWDIVRTIINFVKQRQ